MRASEVGQSSFFSRVNLTTKPQTDSADTGRQDGWKEGERGN